MRKSSSPSSKQGPWGWLGLMGGILLLLLLLPTAAAAQEPAAVSHDGLELVPDTQVALAYVKPDTDFSGYQRFMILEAYVAFQKNWLREQNRSSLSRVTSRDVERMKRQVAKLFREVFTEELEKNGGYEVVKKADPDVLLLRPAIIDLDVTAPDKANSGRSYSFAASTGAATLFLEIYDSVSGEILARVIDRKAANNPGNVMRLSNRATNVAAARRILAQWAGLLRNRLDEIREQE